MVVTPTPSASNSPYSSQLGADISSPYLIDHLFDLSANDSNEPLTPDLQILVLSVKNSDFGSQAQALVIDLIRILAHIRRQNANLWEKQSTLAFGFAGFTAEAQKAAALASARAEIISNVATAIGALVEIGAAAYGLGSSNKAVKQIKAEADAMDWNRPNANANAQDGVDNDFVRPKGAPPAYQEFDAPDGASNIPPKLDSAEEGGVVKNIPSKSGKDGDASQDVDNNQNIDLQAKNQYINDKTRNVYSKLEMQTRLVNALGQFIVAIIKEGGAAQTIEAGEQQALATIDQAVNQYLQNQAQANLDYANEIRDYAKSIIEMIKAIEQARHQSQSAIIQIV